MKKIFFLIFASVTLIAAISIGLDQSNKHALSDLMLNNIEALAQEPVEEEEDPRFPDGEGGVTVTCNRRPEGEGRCWALSWNSPIIGSHCYRVDDPSSRCVEL